MYEDIKSIIGKTLSFVMWIIILSFCIGYTLGSYYGMKSTIDSPRTFMFKNFPGYFILSVQDHPEIKKYK